MTPLTVPLHSTGKLQPLYVGMFGLFQFRGTPKACPRKVEEHQDEKKN